MYAISRYNKNTPVWNREELAAAHDFRRRRGPCTHVLVPAVEPGLLLLLDMALQFGKLVQQFSLLRLVKQHDHLQLAVQQGKKDRIRGSGAIDERGAYARLQAAEGGVDVVLLPHRIFIEQLRLERSLIIEETTHEMLFALRTES